MIKAEKHSTRREGQHLRFWCEVRTDPVQSSALASKNRNASSPDPEQQKGVKAEPFQEPSKGKFTP